MTEAATTFRKTLLALAIWREARGEPYIGKVAVAEVIRNRMKDNRWPKEYEDVILQPYQFSAFNADDVNSDKYPEPLSIAWEECWRAACAVFYGGVTDITRGANHYVVSGLKPKWAKGHEPVVVIGNHSFYKL